jgi:hypothetical protein
MSGKQRDREVDLKSWLIHIKVFAHKHTCEKGQQKYQRRLSWRVKQTLNLNYSIKKKERKKEMKTKDSGKTRKHKGIDSMRHLKLISVQANTEITLQHHLCIRNWGRRNLSINIMLYIIHIQHFCKRNALYAATKLLFQISQIKKRVRVTERESENLPLLSH